MDERTVSRDDSRERAGAGAGTGDSGQSDEAVRQVARGVSGQRGGINVNLAREEGGKKPVKGIGKGRRGEARKKVLEATGKDKEKKSRAPIILPFKATLAYAFLHVGGIDTAIEAARLLAPSDGRYAKLVYAYDDLSVSNKENVHLEDLCSAAEILPKEFLGSVTAAIWEQNVDIGRLISAAARPKVIEATIHSAVAGGAFGMPDRKMLLEHYSFLPQRPGMTVNVDASHKTLNAGKADSQTQIGPGLPSFEDRTVKIGEALRNEDSDIKKLPPAREGQMVEVPSEECADRTILDAELVDS